ENVKSLLKKALSDNERGYGSLDISCSEETLDAFVSASAGDARSALNALENAVLSTEMDENKKIVLTPEIALDCSKNNILALDTDMYYDMLSAFCKSLRGSDADASLYWAFRMIESGIDPMIIFRRLIAHASEDVGLASSNALLIAVSAMQAYEKMGKPEGLLPLSHAIIYVAMSPKSNSVITAMDSARADAVNSYNGQVPAHLKNTNYMNEKREKYIYPHDKGGYVKQQYLPDEFKDRVYYVPSNNGSEKSIKLDEDKIKNIKPKK
ncbi:MAG: replication-associated recombination protein A, partial [Clostridia bacterium]